MENIIERWMPVDPNGFYQGLYEVSNMGRFKMLPRRLPTKWGSKVSKEKIIDGHDSHGYRSVNLKRDRKKITATIHRLVAVAFIDNADNKPYINHKNGIKHDNRVENLEWVTPSENNYHASEIGINNPRRGETHPRAKLTEDQVREIRRLYRTGHHTNRSLSKIFKVGARRICDIVNYLSWTHVQ